MRTNPEAATPTTFVILGATGDLSQRKLMSALLDLFAKAYLSSAFRIVGFSRREFTDGDFREFMRAAIEKREHRHNAALVEEFLGRTSYEHGFFEERGAYKNLAERLSSIDKEFGVCSNKLFYLAVPPNFYEVIFENLAKSGLTIPCGPNEGWTRVLVEKPFGRDAETAKKLDRMLGLLFREEQIFRIDHYLAKETMQNILMFRFSNALFQPMWNKDHIEKVEIQLFETIGMEGRGSFYEDIGALRDVGQNHILQMLAFVAMEDPGKLTAEAIRAERAKVLQALRPIEGEEVARSTLRAQFKGYREEKSVAPDSQTETYFRLEAHVENGRWRGVPFILKSGKEMRETKAEIKIYFKDPGACLCPPDKHESHQNVLTFRIQPDEGISALFWAKKPGFEFGLEPKHLSFLYKDSPGAQALPDAYERVLVDAIRGDQTLFASTEEVGAAWRFITSILEGWRKNLTPLLEYERMSKGPRTPDT